MELSLTNWISRDHFNIRIFLIQDGCLRGNGHMEFFRLVARQSELYQITYALLGDVKYSKFIILWERMFKSLKSQAMLVICIINVSLSHVIWLEFLSHAVKILSLITLCSSRHSKQGPESIFYIQSEDILT